jgi:hypothetical protein
MSGVSGGASGLLAIAREPGSEIARRDYGKIVQNSLDHCAHPLAGITLTPAIPERRGGSHSQGLRHRLLAVAGLAPSGRYRPIVVPDETQKVAHQSVKTGSSPWQIHYLTKSNAVIAC